MKLIHESFHVTFGHPSQLIISSFVIRLHVAPSGNHLVIDAEQGVFSLFLGNRCHARVSHITPPEGKALTDYGLDERGVGRIVWPDGHAAPSSAKYVYFKDACLHVPIAARMRALGWLR